MATPLAKRLPRELKSNAGKYIGILLLMVVSIMFVSGFLVAASSILKTSETVKETYNVEDARFATSFEASDDALAAVEDLGCKVYENFSFDVDMQLPQSATHENATARIYANRTVVDLPAYEEGHEPATKDEIALDRTFCNNNNLHLGDAVQINGSAYTICGIMILPDYQCLFEKNTDFIFDAITFTVAQVTPEAFAALEESDAGETFTYSVLFDDADLSTSEASNFGEDILEALSSNDATVTDYCNIADNQGYAYAADDASGDTVMMEVLMVLLIAIMGFVFAVLTSSTIEEESAIIGTLMASGYRKREIIGHYLAMPAIVGLAAAVVGNAIGYAFFIGKMKDLYYNSYSLPPFQIYFDASAFLFTTVIPFAMLMGIMLVSLLRAMRATPLQFLRHESGRKKARRAFRLPYAWPFKLRFYARIFLQNIPHFITLFFGIVLAGVLLLFGFCMMPTIQNYADGMKSDLVSEHQYMLKAALEIDGTQAERDAWAAAGELVDLGNLQIDEDTTASSLVDRITLAAKALAIDENDHPVNSKAIPEGVAAQAEKYAVSSLELMNEGEVGESVSLYGVQEDSRYWRGLSFSGSDVVITNGFATKYDLKAGDTVTLYDKYNDVSYDLTVSGTFGSMNSVYAYLSLDAFNALLGNEASYFNGYVSNEELDLDERYVANDLTPATMDSIVNQMQNSMGDMASIVVAIAVIIYLVLMYLLTKTVIDHNARAISYMKVFGYRSGEINRLYLGPVAAVVLFSLIVSVPLIIAAIGALVKIAFMEYAGYFVITTPPSSLATIFGMGVATFAVVAAIHTRSIKRVPLSLALKIQE